MSYTITFILAFAAEMNELPSICLLAVASLLYIGAGATYWLPGSFISGSHSRVVIAASFGGFIHTLIVIIYLLTGQQADYLQFFLIIAILIIGYFIAAFLIRSRKRRHLAILDEFRWSSASFANISSPSELIGIAVTGMHHAHPTCIDWSIFKAGVERWPDHHLLWIVFARFAAIYPEEAPLLSHILFSLAAVAKHNHLVQMVRTQASVLQMQREAQLSVELKRKNCHVLKDVAAAKRKLRNVWDLVIQGNITEMESSISMAHEAVNNLTNGYNHILSSYPNNRFVARGYVRFLQEIHADYAGASEWREKTRLLQRGVAITTDIAHKLGLEQFPELPVRSSEFRPSAPTGDQEGSLSNLQDDPGDDDARTLEQLAILRRSIENLRIPAVTSGILVPILLFVFGIFAPVVVIFAIVPTVERGMAESLEFSFGIARMRSFGFALPLWAHHWLGETVVFGDAPLFEVFEARHERISLGPDAYETRGQLEFFLRGSSALLESLGQFRSFYRKSPRLEKVHTDIFTRGITYDYYYDISHYKAGAASVFSFLIDANLQISDLLQMAPSLSGFNTSHLVNPVVNSHDLAEIVNEDLGVLTAYLMDEINKLDRIISIVQYAAIPVEVAVWLSLLVWQFLRMRGNRAELYKCLTALPKSCVSALSESLRVIRSDQEQKSQAGECEISKQEENLLKLSPPRATERARARRA
jgi:hypothetical protein